LSGAYDCVLAGFDSIPLLSMTEYLRQPALFFWGQLDDGESRRSMSSASRVLIVGDDPDEWIMTLLPEHCYLEPEAALGWREYDYRRGWCARPNFYLGEWLTDKEHRSVNGKFFRKGSAAFTRSANALTQRYRVPASGSYTIASRGFSCDEDKPVRIMIDGSELEFDYRAEGAARLQWMHRVCMLDEGECAVTLAGSGSRAIVDTIAIFTDEDKEKAVQEAERIIGDKQCIYLFDLRGSGDGTQVFRVYREGVYEFRSLSPVPAGLPHVLIDGMPPSPVSEHAPNGVLFKLMLRKGMHKLTVDKAEERELIMQAASTGKEGFLSVKRRLTVKRYGPTRIVLEQFEADRPMVLVFNELYHGGWKAYAMDRDRRYYTGLKSVMNLFVARDDFVELREHQMVNGYGNAFFINKPGTYRILLEFAPQNDYEKGILISLSAGILMLAMLVATHMRGSKG